MLFDLEDYRWGGIIGPDNKPANQINWANPYTTFRATRDSYLKSVNEYFLASQVMCTPEEAQTLNVKILAFLDSNLILGPLSRQFWNAMVSLPLAGQLNVGDRFDVLTEVNKNAQDSSYIAYPNYTSQTWWIDNYKSVAVLNSENGEYVYTEMTQQLHDDYKAAFVVFQSKLKDIIIISEGGVENFNDYVAPAAPAWDSYPELSGYVRGTNSLSIKDAVVRLVDADGVNHDIVTDVNGYYKFSKEMFYNTIAFDHGATASSFNMFVLEHTLGSTASLYDPANILQNSFFGAENNREMTWSVSVKMGKPARRNFKLEFIPDYSAYPSLSGHIYDQDGNPAENALVELKYFIGQGFDYTDGDVSYDGWVLVGSTYDPIKDKFTKTTKFKVFGEEVSILTDENGHYEYPSQLIGEWFNNHVQKMYIKRGVQEEQRFSSALLHNPNVPVTGFYIDENYTPTGSGVVGFSWNGQIGNWPEKNAIGVQSDGKVIIGGDIWNYGGQDLPKYPGQPWSSSILRLNTDGSMDTSFNPGIKRTGGDQPYLNSLHVLSDDRLIIGGNFDEVQGVTSNGLVILNSDGVINTAYPDSQIRLMTNAKKLSNGKILAYGQTLGGVDYGNVVQEKWGDKWSFFVIEEDGTINTSFIKAVFTQPSNMWVGPYRLNIFLNSDGSFFIAGEFELEAIGTDGNTTGYIAKGFAKFNSDGSVDETFVCDLSGSSTDFIPSSVTAMLEEEDGNFIISGDIMSYVTKDADGNYVYDVVNQWGCGFLRISPTGSLVSRFEGAGNPNTNGSPEGNIGDILIGIELIDTPDGKVLFCTGNGGGVYLIDYSTGLCKDQYIGLNHTLKASVKVGNDMLLAGQFTSLFDNIVKPSTDYFSDGLENKYNNQLGGLARIKYGDYYHYDNVYVSEQYYLNNVQLTSVTNANSRYNKHWTINDLKASLNPWIQNLSSGEVYSQWDKDQGKPEPVKIYNYQDWFNSRFAYSFNQREEEYAIELHGGAGKDATLDIHEMLVDQETGAERAYLKYTKSTFYGAPGNWNQPFISFKSTSGYVLVKTSSGEQIIGNGQTGSGFVETEDNGLGGPDGNGWISLQFTNEYFNEDDKNTDGTWDIYFYACEPEHGAASGQINLLDVTGLIVNDMDVSEMANLEYLQLASRLLDITPSTTDNTIPVDVSGCIGLKCLKWDSMGTHALNITGINQIPSLKRLQMGGFAYTSKIESSTESQYTFDRSVFRYDGGSPYARTSFGEAKGFVKMSDGKIVVIDASSYNSVYSYNPDGTQIQLPPMRGIVRLNEDLSVDTTFNNYYTYFTTNPNLSNGFNSGSPTCIDKQSDEKIIIGGQFASYNEQNLDYCHLMRINPNGSRDIAFTNKLSQNSGLEINYVSRVKVLANDKILVCGDIYVNGNYKGLVKLNADGSRDTSFNIAESVSYNGQVPFALQSTGKILASVENGYKVKRFNENGALDSTFTPIENLGFGFSGEVKSIAIQSDDKIIVTGSRIYTFYDESWGGIDLHVARFESNGVVDLQFNQKLAKYEIKTGSVDYTNILSDGTIIISGNFNWYVYSPELDLTLPSSEWIKIWENDQWGINATREIKIVLDENGDEKVDYFPSNKNAYNYDMYREFIESGDDLFILLPKETNFRYEDRETGDMCFCGIGKFVKRPKTTFKFEVNNPSISVFNDNSGVSSGNYSGQNLKKLIISNAKSISLLNTPNLENLALYNFKGTFSADNLSSLTYLSLYSASLDFTSLNLPALISLDVQNSYSGGINIDLSQTSLVNITFNQNNISHVIIPETAKSLSFSNSGCPIFGESYVDYLYMNGGYAYSTDPLIPYTIKAKACNVSGVTFPTGNEVALIVDSGEISYQSGGNFQINWCDLWQKDIEFRGYLNEISLQGTSLREMLFDNNSKTKYFTTSRHNGSRWFNNIDLSTCTDLVYFMYYDYTGANGTTVNLPVTTTLSEVRVIGNNWSGGSIKIAEHAEQMLQALVDSGRTGGTVTLQRFQGSSLITTLKNTLVSRGWNVNVQAFS